MSKWLNGLMGKAISYGKNSIKMLVNEIQESSSSEQRLKSINELIALSDDPDNIKSIGAAIPSLIQRMKTDVNLPDYCSLALSLVQLFINIMSITGSEDNIVPLDSVQYANITIFTEDYTNTTAILGLLNENNFKADGNKKPHEYKKLQYYTTKLLTILLANKCEEVEYSILQSAEHISRLMDLLRLKSEMIRNQALLLLTELTKTNAEIKKIVAFQDGFELLMNIMEEENLSSGGIIVQDCLMLMNNLLKDNTANQNHFRIIGCIHKVKNILVLELSDFWFLTDDKRDILYLALETVSLLVSSDKPQENQNILESNGTLKSVAKIVIYCNDTHIRLKALSTLVDLIEDNMKSKMSLRNMTFESSKPNEPPQSFLTSVFNIFGSSGDERTQKEFKKFILTWTYDYEDLLKYLCNEYPQYLDQIRHEMVEKKEIHKISKESDSPHKDEISQLQNIIAEKDKLIYSYQVKLQEMELNYRELKKKYEELNFEHEELLIALAQMGESSDSFQNGLD